MPIVAHPPCRAWGRYKGLAKPLPHEKELARQAVKWVREFGGMLEHSAHSDLWKDQSLPMPDRGVDAFSGFTLDVARVWWGHKAEKRTWLYICGVEPFLIPLIPYCLGRGTHVIGQSKRLKERPEVTKAEREHTPMSFCKWLVDLAGRTSRREITA